MKELIRRLLQPLACLIVRIGSQPLAIPAGGRCVIVAPHQDDEALGCAGLILAQRANGVTVNVVYITDGAGSHPGHPRLGRDDIAKIRRNESINAMQQLKVDSASLHFVDAPDGSLTRLSPPEAEDLARRLSTLLNDLQPTELFIACRDDSSSEHTGAFELTLRALHLANLHLRLLEYPIWARWRPQQLLAVTRKSRKVWRLVFRRNVSCKRAALDAYVSQTSATPPWKNPVLPRGFVSCFDSPEEFFFER